MKRTSRASTPTTMQATATENTATIIAKVLLFALLTELSSPPSCSALSSLSTSPGTSGLDEVEGCAVMDVFDEQMSGLSGWRVKYCLLLPYEFVATHITSIVQSLLRSSALNVWIRVETAPLLSYVEAHLVWGSNTVLLRLAHWNCGRGKAWTVQFIVAGWSRVMVLLWYFRVGWGGATDK